MYLFGDPSPATLWGVTLAVGVDDTVLNGVGLPPFLEIGRLEISDHGPAGFGDDIAKEPVGDLAFLPVERTCLCGATDAAGELLLVDESLYTIYLLVVEGDVERGEGDGLAGEPADALKHEDGVCVIAERLVLWGAVSAYQARGRR
jgi:hypothetical protein